MRYVGCSNLPAYQVARAIGRSEALGLSRFESVQPRYNMLFRQAERELLPLCAEEGIGVLPYNPIAGGMLSGKHQPGEPTKGTRFTVNTVRDIYHTRYWREDVFDTVNQLRPIAAESGRSMVSLAIGCVLANPAITAPIIGASRPEQLDDPVAAATSPIPADLKEHLDGLTHAYRMGDATH